MSNDGRMRTSLTADEIRDVTVLVRAIERRHEEQNDAVGRPQSRSTTLRLARQALAILIDKEPA